LTARRAEDFDPGSGGRDWLGEDQCDDRRSRLQDCIRRGVRLNELSMGKDVEREQCGSNGEAGDRKSACQAQE
jgi:hypothetical protein